MNKVTLQVRDRLPIKGHTVTQIGLAKLRHILRTEFIKEGYPPEVWMVATELGVDLHFAKEAEIQQVYMVVQRLEKAFGYGFHISKLG